MIREELDLSKYEKQIKRVYPFLSDEFVKELTEELYEMCERSCE
jgi:hypothetical protein